MKIEQYIICIQICPAHTYSIFFLRHFQSNKYSVLTYLVPQSRMYVNAFYKTLSLAYPAPLLTRRVRNKEKEKHRQKYCLTEKGMKIQSKYSFPLVADPDKC